VILSANIQTAPALAAPAHGDAARRLRIVAIAMICATMLCFAGLDTCAKWLGVRLPTVEVVWARYVGAAVLGLVAARPFSRPGVLRAGRPGMQFFRSCLLLASTIANFVALRYLQLAETSTINFLTPLFVLLAWPLLGEKAGPARLAVIAVGFLGVLIATRPGTSAFQPVVLISIGGVVCNAGYAIATRALADHDAPETTLAWTPLAGVLLLTPALPFVWVAPPSLFAWGAMAAMGLLASLGHGLLILAHQRAPAPVLAPFNYTQLIWMILSGYLVFGDAPPAATLMGAALVVACGLFLIMREKRGRG
jgi:drug/metabolite transporter (DMT)-like permease